MLQSGRQLLAFASKVAMHQSVVHAVSCGNFTNGRRGWALVRKQLAGRYEDGGDDFFFANWFCGV